MKDSESRARQILQKRDETLANSRQRSKKTLRISVIAAVLAAAVLIPTAAVVAKRAAKAPSNGENSVTQSGRINGTGSSDEEAENTGAAGTEPSFSDGIIGGSGKSDSPSFSGIYPSDKTASMSKGEKEEHYYSEPAEAYVVPGHEMPDAAEPDAPEMKAGTLTAGEWKDLENLSLWYEKLAQPQWAEIAEQRKIVPTRIITVTVKDGEAPCFNTAVTLLSGDDELFAARTDVNGNAYLPYGDNGTYSVRVGDETFPLEGKDKIEVQAKDAGIGVTALDLMLMIDTTGSMGDELEYIKYELSDLVSRIREAGGNLSVRVSVNFYRDEGDEYVVKYYDFRTDINECLEQIKNEYASGGGDYPEAVHTALENAVTGHTWREDAVKLCYLVLDAPPHDEREAKGVTESLQKSVAEAAKQGIRIIPVASSGVDLTTEIILRSFAASTGGTYIFITDDSGVGGGHKEAEVGEHVVETLNECMIRVSCEYCGIYRGGRVPYTQTSHN